MPGPWLTPARRFDGLGQARGTRARTRRDGLCGRGKGRFEITGYYGERQRGKGTTCPKGHFAITATMAGRR
eukprot:gene25376-biopygen15024